MFIILGYAITPLNCLMLTKLPIVIEKGSVVGTLKLDKKSPHHKSKPYRLSAGSKYYPVLRIIGERKSGLVMRKGRGVFMPHLDNKYMGALYEKSAYDQLINYIYLTYVDMEYHIYRQYRGPRDPLFNGIFTATGACHFTDMRVRFEKLYHQTLIDSLIKLRDRSLSSWKKKKSDIITFITQALVRIFTLTFIDNVRTDTRIQRSFDNDMLVMNNANVESDYINENLLGMHVLNKAKPA